MTHDTRVIIIDDEADIARALVPSLTLDGYVVSTREDARSGIDFIRTNRPDLIILDLGLPDMDGKEAIRAIRTFADTPIIVLSARHMEAEKVAALDLGANDYVDKPFSLIELLARMRAAARVNAASKGERSRFARSNLSIDYLSRRVIANGKDVHLTPKEFKILQLLTEHADQVVTQKQLLDTVWSSQERRDSQTLRVTVKNLRQKIEADPSQPVFIVTIPGVGYRLTIDEAEA